MAKKGGGGGGKPSPFSQQFAGVLEYSGKEVWLNLGTIPNGQQYQLGQLDFTPIDADIKCDIRPNLTTKSAGTDSDTVLVGSSSTKAGTSKRIDLWRGGRLNTVTPVSTGVECIWLKFTSRKASTTEIIYSLSYLEL